MSLVLSFQKNLRRARRASGLSQTKLAKKAGICVSYVSMLERGNRQPPLQTIESLGRALNVPPLSLLRPAA